jgi:hypothetical protein
MALKLEPPPDTNTANRFLPSSFLSALSVLVVDDEDATAINDALWMHRSILVHGNHACRRMPLLEPILRGPAT